MLRLEETGQTLIETVIGKLREAGLEPGLVVANNPEEYRFLGLTVEKDIVPDCGPLGGILTALVVTQQPRVFVVACDMPLLCPPLIRYMATLPDEEDALVPRWIDDHQTRRVEALHAVYSSRCIEPLRLALAEGRRKAGAFLNEVNTRYLGAELRQFDPTFACFRNLNTPEDLLIHANADQ